MFWKSRKAPIKKKIQHSIVSQTLILGDEKIEYTLIRDSYKTLRLRVKADASVEVKGPKRYQQVFIDAFLQKKASWIREKRSDALEKGIKPKMDFSQGSPCFCLGKEFLLHYYGASLESTQNINLREANSLNTNIPHINLVNLWQDGVLKNTGQFLCGEEIYKTFWQIANSVHGTFRLATMEATQYIAVGTQGLARVMPTLFIEAKQRAYKDSAAINVWRKKTAELFLQMCLDRVWENLCGAPINDEQINNAPINDEQINAHQADSTKNPSAISKEIQSLFCKIKKPDLRVRVLSRRFGSCSTKGEICLARHLISYPLDLIEYVIIHECCHLVYMNHSKSFYNIMEKCCANARQKRENLWDWSRKHPNF